MANDTGSAIGRVLGIVAAVAAVAIGLFWLGTSIFRSDDSMAQAFGPVDRIVVHTNGHVDIRPGDATDVTVHRRWSINRPEVSMNEQDGELTVITQCGWLAIRCRADVIAVVPADAEVFVETSAGTVNVRGMTGGVDLSTSAGGIQVDVAGPARLRTSAGSVGGVVRDGDVDAATSAGSIELDVLGEFSRISAVTSAGRVRLGVPDAAYRVDTETSAGRVTVDVATDPSSPAEIYARTSAGSITIVPTAGQ